ncbi:hypothetical protein OEV98_15080 [Caldibacillus lycopersici]|uniref:Uncharacterized protein n=1 Tax=Perspicuibacillus lycopersici TaxID=1325689 RepID=A0AAE3IUQ1_9BACI|nr:hypothetical protein [Perspicuibacillus lycopersici]MCU9614866.1 hypothetical protein [Perspicuibacillus lycopersici]
MLNFITSLLASSLTMKHNLAWHRRILLFSIPLVIIFGFVQTEYIVHRIKNSK